MRKLFSFVLALLAALFAAVAGTGVAILVTHTYWSAEYSIFATLLSAAASWALFRVAKRQLWK